MINTKFVTVVIPTFKRSFELKRALSSVLVQSFNSFDIIVVDDNNDEDESAKVEKICKAYKAKYIKNFRKKGGCGSRNSGVLSTSSKFIAFLDDDDLWFPNKLELQCDFLLKEDIYSAVFCNFYSYNIDDRLIRSVESGSDITHNDLLKGKCPASTSLLMVDRKLIIDAGLFDEDLPSFQDYDMWLRLSLIKPIGFLNKKLAIFTQHSGDRVSINLDKRFQGIELIINKWGGDIEQHNKISAFRKKYKSAAYSSNALSVTGHSYKKMVLFRFLSLMNNTFSLNCWKAFLGSLLGSSFYYMLLKFKLDKNFKEKNKVEKYLEEINNKSNSM